jgi:hypothetical protein
MFLYHLREVAAHAQLRQIAVVEADVDGSVIVGVYYEIGDDLLQVPSDGFTQRCARTGVELGDLFKCLIEVFFVQSQLFDDLFPMLAGELFVTFTDDFFFRLQQRICAMGLFFAADLYQQAFLQAACAQSGRVEILYDSQGFLQFLFRRLIRKALIRLWTSRERLLVNQEKYQTTWEQIQLFMKTSTQLLQVNSLVMTR